MIISQACAIQLEVRNYLISNYYFPGLLGSRVLAIWEQKTWDSSESHPLLQKVNYSYFFFCFVAEIIYRLPMRRIGCLASILVTRLGRQFFFVSGKYTLIKFHSDRGIQKRGFLISFTAVVPLCKK